MIGGERSRQYQSRHEIADCLNPLNGYRGQLQAKGIEVKNHMKDNRAALRKTADAFNKKQEVAKAQSTPSNFKMKKFQNVESKIKQEKQYHEANDDVRPIARERPNSSSGFQRTGQRAAFGRSNSNSGLNAGIGAQKNKIGQKMSARGLQSLNKNALEQLNTRSKPNNRLAEVDNQIMVPEDQENINMQNKPQLPPKTPNYGKTPKYLNKYKEQAKEAADSKQQMKLAKQRPAGTKILPEEERIQTLENLERNKKEITRILMQMPISMRTDSLRKQKVELERKLVEIDRALEMFSRKIVYVKEDE